MAEMLSAKCPDCQSVCTFSFALLYMQGKVPGILMVAPCKVCWHEGDRESVFLFEPVAKKVFKGALRKSMPVMLNED